MDAVAVVITLAAVIANTTGSRFEALNGVESNVAEIRAKIEQARAAAKAAKPQDSAES